MRKNILIVEDEVDSLNLLHLILDSEGYNIFLANNREKALKVIEEEHIDLVVLDLMIPKTSGKAILKKIRESKNNAKTKVIVLTGLKLTEKEKEKLRKLDVQEFLYKPTHVEEVRGKIRKALKAE
jgi:DNA-binding response OmpR family regulator